MKSGNAQRVARMGMLFALAIALSWLESFITPFLGLMPAVKIGLSNIVVMFALLQLGRSQAAALVLLKALFALLTRGVTAGFLSLAGGGLSFLALCLLLALPVPVTGWIFSVCGALCHNLGQLAGAAVVFSSGVVFGYAPILLISGLIVGSVTWTLLKALMPYFGTVAGENGKQQKSRFKKKS